MPASPQAPPRCLIRLGASGCIEVQLPFDAVTQAQLRAVRPRGHWLARRGCWQFPLEAAGVLRQRFGGRFAVDPALQQWFAWLEQPLPPLPPHRTLVEVAELQQPLPDGRELFAHQRAAARWLLARRGAVLADAMGLGKTLTALAAARAMVRAADCRIVVVAPAGLHHHWQQEASALQLQLERRSLLLPVVMQAGWCHHHDAAVRRAHHGSGSGQSRERFAQTHGIGQHGAAASEEPTRRGTLMGK